MRQGEVEQPGGRVGQAEGEPFGQVLEPLRHFRFPVAHYPVRPYPLVAHCGCGPEFMARHPDLIRIGFYSFAHSLDIVRVSDDIRVLPEYADRISRAYPPPVVSHLDRFPAARLAGFGDDSDDCVWPD